MMHLGLFLAGEGHHVAAWRDPAAPKGANQDIRHFVELARSAERARFDFLFTADTNAVFGKASISRAERPRRCVSSR